MQALWLSMRSIDELWVCRAEVSGDADAYNYLGYSYRQAGKLDDAYKYYQMALKIDPNHKGANAYLGELYLMKNDLPKAEENLSVIKKACPSGCVEYDTLKQAVDDYKKTHKLTIDR
jgi:tetratricopeptide (TPR) repeat protein